MAIYFDMDAVLADFRGGVMQAGGPYDPTHGKDKAADDAMWKTIKAAPHFYRALPEIPSNVRLFRRMADAGLAPEVLTAVPKPKYGMPEAADDKIAWNREHLGPDVKTHICFRAEKIQWCHGPEDVLIDDHEGTIQEWRGKGGTGVLFREGEELKLPPRITMALQNAQEHGASQEPRTEPEY